METRAILAFILSMLVFVGWNYIIAPPPGQDTVEYRSNLNETQGRAPTSPPAGKTGKMEIPSIPKPSSPEPLFLAQPSDLGVKSPFDSSAQTGKVAKDITVTLKNSKLVFTTAGAGIKSFLSFKYTNQKGGPLELIQTSEENIPSPQISLDDKNLTVFAGRSIYEASAEELVLTEFNPTGKLTFSLKDPSGLEVVKEYSFRFDSYKIDCAVSMRYGSHPLRSLRFTWNDGISSGKDEKDFYAYEGPTTLVGLEREEDSDDDIAEEGPVRHIGDLKWTAYQNKYFAVAMIPMEKNVAARIERGRNNIATIGLEYGLDSFPFQKEFSIYLGPKEMDQLESLKDFSLDRLIDYGWFGNKVGFLVKPLFHFLQYFYSLTGNYGWSIIFLTMIIKIVFFPLSYKSFKSMKNMQKLQPEIKILQERYKDDKQMLSKEMMRIYRENKVNPLGGCLPMVLQIPVFISLYHVLLISIELRNAPFIMWIMDLSEKDPYYVTPVLMGASMFLQQKMTPSVGDPAQQKIMMLLPIVFTFLFLNFPSGLVIYWLVNNVLTIGQQYYIINYSK